MMRSIVECSIAEWSPAPTEHQIHELAAALERGSVLYFPQLRFHLDDGERAYLDPRWADPRCKNICYDGERDVLAGAVGSASERDGLRAMLRRYRERSIGLIGALFPNYRPRLRAARTSFRPVRVEGRATSWRKDDRQLHFDAFPSSPNHGERILRVFHNANPAGEPRVWRLGEPFEDAARHFLPEVTAPLPGSAWLMERLHITKRRRSRYDHIMLQLHDRMKADKEYQQRAPQVTVALEAGSTWICFSDQTAHAAMSGQFLIEQTLHLPVEALYEPAQSPLRILERLTGAKLV
jgi:hypothetical protein